MRVFAWFVAYEIEGVPVKLAHRIVGLMSSVIMIAGWITTIAMIGFCALNESSKLPTLPKGLAASCENASPSF